MNALQNSITVLIRPSHGPKLAYNSSIYFYDAKFLKIVYSPQFPFSPTSHKTPPPPVS